MDPNNTSDQPDFVSSPSTEVQELVDEDFLKPVPEDFDFDKFFQQENQDPNNTFNFESEAIFNEPPQGDDRDRSKDSTAIPAWNDRLETNAQTSAPNSEDPPPTDDQQQVTSSESDGQRASPGPRPDSSNAEFYWLRDISVKNVAAAAKRERKEQQRSIEQEAKSIANVDNQANTSNETAATTTTDDLSMIGSNWYGHNPLPTTNPSMTPEDSSSILWNPDPYYQPVSDQVSNARGGEQDLGVDYDDQIFGNTLAQYNNAAGANTNLNDFSTQYRQPVYAAHETFRQSVSSDNYRRRLPSRQPYQMHQFEQANHVSSANPQQLQHRNSMAPIYSQDQSYELPPIPDLFPSLEPEAQPETPMSSKPKKQPKNGRSENIEEFKRRKNYNPLPKSEIPKSWGSLKRDTGRPTFEYTATGELKPHFKFSVKQLHEYLSTHPKHSTGRFTLWLQICPADSNDLYPSKESHKCRFRKCAIDNHTISVGDYRVAFDEHSPNDLNLDPLQSTAGYVHLYCLEKHFDFPQLCKDFNIRAETRWFENPSKFAINRDRSWCNLERVIDHFMYNCQSWNNQRDPATWYTKSLSYALTLEHLANEQRTRQKKRESRGGNSIDKHFNNLDIKQKNISIKKSKSGLPLIIQDRPPIEKPVKSRGSNKRKASDDSEASSSKSASPSKRIKVGDQDNTEVTAPRNPRSRRRRSSRLSFTQPTIVQPPQAPKVEPDSSPTRKRKSSTDDDSDSIGAPAKKPKILRPTPKTPVVQKPTHRQSPRRPSSEDAASDASGYLAEGSSSNGFPSPPIAAHHGAQGV